MASTKSPFAQKLIEKFSNSRDFTISFVLHVILVAIFGGTVLFQAVQEPPDFEGEGGGFVGGDPNAVAPPPDVQQQVPQTPNITVTPTTPTINTITTVAPSPTEFTMAQMIVAPIAPTAPAAVQMAAPKPAGVGGEGLSNAQASAIKAFTGGWGKGQGSGTGTRNREFEFTAYIGQYDGGNWKSTIEVVNNKIEKGSLPNLLDFMFWWSKNKVKTNYTNVQAIKLDSDQLFSVKPPFVFLTGTKDFKLSEKEVENLRKYVRIGGAIWGDSSVPGRNSRFDIAFRREMKRVIPDVDKDWEALPANHPIYTQAYFPEVKDIPPGLNFYKEPIYALKIYGEIAIIYTANDYGDMWQVGLDNRPGPTQGQVDLRRDESVPGKPFVATNPKIYDNREVYLRNVTPQALAQTYKFGTNLVLHLLTRWESKTRTASSL